MLSNQLFCQRIYTRTLISFFSLSLCMCKNRALSRKQLAALYKAAARRQQNSFGLMLKFDYMLDEI